MSTPRVKDTNYLLADSADVLAFSSDTVALERMRDLKVDWRSGLITHASPRLQQVLTTRKWAKQTDGTFSVTDDGLAFLSKFLIDFEHAAKAKDRILGKFRIEQMLAAGRNSVTFRAFHEAVGRSFVLKFLRPGRARDIISKLRLIGEVRGEPYLVHPVDFFEWPFKTIAGDAVTLACVVYPFTRGQTLEAFLAEQQPISPYLILAYVEQVGSALAALQDQGLHHGDLHSHNILIEVDDDKNVLFRVIDISYGMEPSSPYGPDLSDFEYFRAHLAKTLWLLQHHLQRISLQKHLGARLYTLVERILSGPVIPFSTILHWVHKNTPYEEYKEKRTSFLAQKFTKPSSLGLLRYEEIVDPTMAVNLFEPYEELFTEFQQFGSAVLFGHRGSGKSTYLAALAFFPSVKQAQAIVDYRKTFGVFFACRQGEFKQFNPSLLRFAPATYVWLKHILLLKVIRRTIGLLKKGVECGTFAEPTDCVALTEFLEKFVRRGATFNFPSTYLSALENIHASLLRNEILEIDELFKGRSTISSRLLNEEKFAQFLHLVRVIIPELHETRFYLLFDDAGEPNLPREVQMVVNELIRCVNSTFCVKVSAERYSYHFQAADLKTLEDPHDFIRFNISEIISLGSGRSPERREAKRYFERLVARRLLNSKFKSQDIVDYLGAELITLDQLVERLSAKNSRTAYFCGWNIIWQLADRTTRHLLEMISSIFAAAKVDRDSTPRQIQQYLQHRAVKGFSEKKLKALAFVPGAIQIGDKKVGLGKQLYDFAASFGKVAVVNLRRGPMVETPERKRFHEKLAIEIDGELRLAPEAQTILEQLIRFAVIDDSILVKAFDDRTKKSIYVLNRVFCPALGISIRRETHWRLSTAKFEEFLLHPARFVRNDAALAKLLEEEGIPTKDIFPEEE